MAEEKNYIDIPKEMFEFTQKNEKITDKKFDTKPIGYFKDAMIRFSKNKGSVISFIIIGIIILYAIFIPMLVPSNKATTMDTYYAKAAPRITWVKNATGNKMLNGGSNEEYNVNKVIYEYAIGVAAESKDGNIVKMSDSYKSEYQPVNYTNGSYKVKQGRNSTTYYKVNIDNYLEVGFVYLSVEQSEYQNLLKWQEQTGKQLVYPLIDESSPYYCGNLNRANSANYWYKAASDKLLTAATPLTVGGYELTKQDITENGILCPVATNGNEIEFLKYSDNLVLEDNYLRDGSGNLVYTQAVGGGNDDTHQLKVRVLYYNYYQYKNGFLPDYFFGTDSQGYDLAYRMATGLRLSLLLAVVVSLINFVIGALYGAVEGYYGGAIDLTMERVSDILAGIPFVVVSSLFQMHLASKVGPIPSLIFAFIITGWIGTAAQVRTQFYRFKNQEYVMAARTLGARDRRIIWKHIFPNTLGTLVTSSVLVIPSVIFSESMLSYLGIVNLGGSKTTSLGTLLSEASGIWTQFPHLMIFPATIISLLMICFNLFGNGLRDAFNPQLRGTEE